MAREFCAFLWSPACGFEHGGAHAHRFRDPWTPGGMRTPRWAFPDFANGLCCEFCRTSSNIPGLREGLVELSHILPPIVHSMLQAFHHIHHHYQVGFHNGGEEHYFLARELEDLSRYVRKLYRAFPDMVELALWADQLKHLGRDIQLEPRRFRHNPMLRHRQHRRLLAPQIDW